MAAVLLGLGVWLPSEIVTNAMLEASLDTSSEWIESRTGIRERRMVPPGISTGDLAVEAGSRALKSAGLAAVDAVVVATTSPDRICPAVAPEVASRLGQGGVAAFDLTSACSGFVYGLATAAGLIDSGVAATVLLIGAEAFTTFVNPDDRTTAPIFGDGAGATVLCRGDPGEWGALGPFDLGSDGARADLLAIPAGGSRQRSANDLAPAGAWYLQMDGQPLFRHAVDRMAQSSQAVLDRAGWSALDVDVLIGHQANARIVRAVAEELELPAERIALNIDRVGNTLAASIPILLNDAVDNAMLKPGRRVLLTAFGAGLSWGSTVLTWPDISVAEINYGQ